jgi:hypothetical protein
LPQIELAIRGLRVLGCGETRVGRSCVANADAAAGTKNDQAGRCLV